MSCPIAAQDLRLIASYGEIASIIAGHLESHALTRELNILEAGCGRMWEFTALEVPYRLTGVDIDVEALSFRKDEQKDLDQAIEGDLRDIALPDQFFDVIYSSYVLEHVRGAEAVLTNFVRWLRPGGLLILKIPDRDSVHGFVTRITPHWCHVLFYRYLRGQRSAGTRGHGPYPTFYDRILSRRALLNFAQNSALEVREVCGYHNYLSSLSMSAFIRLMRVLSFGRLQADHENLLFIFEKPASAPLTRSRHASASAAGSAEGGRA